MKCECGREITKIQDKENEEIAQESKTKKLNMCCYCWIHYCHHATTGDKRRKRHKRKCYFKGGCNMGECKRCLNWR